MTSDLDFRPPVKDLPGETLAMLGVALASQNAETATFTGTLTMTFETKVGDKRVLGGSLIAPGEGRWVIVQEPCLSRIERLIRDGQALTITGRYADGDDRLVEIVDLVDPA